MSFPKIRDFIGKVKQKNQYKSISLKHSLKNSFNRNIITPSKQKIRNNIEAIKLQNNNSFINTSATNLFGYQQCLPGSFHFSDDDLYKLLQHLFNKRQHDLNDRNFIRRLLLKYFPEEVVCAGGRDFVNHLRFLKLNKNQIVDFQDDDNNQLNIQKNMFYFVLRGKLLVAAQNFQYKKSTSQYFGHLEILSSQPILYIKAKTDTLLLTISQEHFNRYFSNYFKSNHENLLKQLGNETEEIINLTAQYRRLLLLDKMYEKEYKTGDKIIQKGEIITEIVFINQTQISHTPDKIIHEFKIVGLNEFVYSQPIICKQTIYCMENAQLMAIKVQDFQKFIERTNIQKFLSTKFITSNLSSKKLLNPAQDDETTCSLQKTPTRFQQFLNVKRVKFFGSNRKMLTEPNGATVLSSPKNNVSKYPQFSTSFVFIKQNTPSIYSSISAKSNRMKNVVHKFNKRQFKDTFMKTKNSIKTKRWLDQFNLNQSSIICNPQKMRELSTEKKLQINLEN